MTSNAIKMRQHNETVRHNKVTEELQREQNATNRGAVDETNRHNKVSESIEFTKQAEVQRHNLAGEAIDRDKIMATIRGQDVSADATRYSANKHAEASKYSADQSKLASEWAAGLNYRIKKYEVDTRSDDAGADRVIDTLNAASNISKWVDAFVPG